MTVSPARRAAYGPTSPHIGAAGSRTRERIVHAALEVFDATGYHRASTEEIAGSAGVSRATFYQYFASKEELFHELVEQNGAAILRLLRRLGPLGPHEEGFENLHWWLGEFAYIYDKYATVFIQWSNVDGPGGRLRPMARTFEGAYITAFSSRLTRAGVDDLDHAATAMVLLSTINRYNYYRHTRPLGVSDDVLLDTLARVTQLFLFPATPWDQLCPPFRDQPALAAPPAPGPTAPPAAVRPRTSRRSRPPARDPERLTAQAAATRRALLDAGSAVFARMGYEASNADLVAREAGVSHGTFYVYFADKLDLLRALALDCAETMEPLSKEFAAVAGDPPALRGWLDRYVDGFAGHAAAVRAWSENTEPDPVLDDTARLVVGSLLGSFRRVLGSGPGAGLIDADAAAIALISLIERVPADQLALPATARGVLVDTMAAFIERGLLAGTTREQR